jgi:hypothetical protein
MTWWFYHLSIVRSSGRETVVWCKSVALGGLVVSMLAIESQDLWVQTRLRTMDFFKNYKNIYTTPFAGEVKLSIPPHKILWHGKALCENERGTS